jgi:uncharacterized protein YbaR (Trm112 family)
VLAREESIMIQKDVLAILCCPDDRSALVPANESIVAEINQAICRGKLRNRANEVVKYVLDGGLIKANAELLYPIVDGIPVLVREEAIPLAQLARGGGSPSASANS